MPELSSMILRCCYGGHAYSYIISYIEGLTVEEYIELDKIGVNAYAIRMKLYKS